MAPLTLRLNDSWINLSGNYDKPRYLFLVDRTAAAVSNQLDQFGLNENDLIVQFAVGTFKNLNDFLKLKAREFFNAKAVIVLWVGMDELAIDASSLPPLIIPHSIRTFTLLGRVTFRIAKCRKS